MAGISSKAVGKLDNKKKFNGIEHTTDLDLNQYDAFFRTMDPQVGRWWQIDPKPNEMFSPYAAMANNPLLYSDPLGDTTWIYGRNGALVGTINDGLKNQVHFVGFEYKGEAFQMEGSAKELNKAARSWRSSSIAFMGSKTLGDMKKIEVQSTKNDKEVAFVGQIGPDREIRLKAMPIDENNFRDQVNIGSQLDKNYTKDQHAGFFLVGHVHHGKLSEGITSGSGSPMEQHKYFGDPSPGDYGPYLYRSAHASQRGQSAALLLSHFGATVYGTGSHIINTSPTQSTTAGKVYPHTQSYI